MIISPNLALKIWNLLTDPYDHAQLMSNWNALDLHDHTFGKGVQVPTGGIADSAVTDVKIATGTITADKLSPSIAGAFVPTGGILPFGGSSSPTGYLLCDGSAVSRITFATLYSVIATAYGAGNGSTTFNLPDLRQRFPLGKSASGTGSALGATGGAIDHTHTVSASFAGLTIPSLTLTIPQHSHPLSGNGGAALRANGNANGSTDNGMTIYSAGGGPNFTYTGFANLRTFTQPPSSSVASNVGGIGNGFSLQSYGLLGNTDLNSGGTTTSVGGGGTTTGSGSINTTTSSANAPFVTVNYIIKI